MMRTTIILLLLSMTIGCQSNMSTKQLAQKQTVTHVKHDAQEAFDMMWLVLP